VYYPFNGNAKDMSGNGNDAIVFGAKLSKDRYGHSKAAYTFDGINDYIETNNLNQNIVNSSGFSYMAIVKINSIDKNKIERIKKGKPYVAPIITSINQETEFQFSFNKKNHDFYLYIKDNIISIDVKKPKNYNTYIGTYDKISNKSILYVNGEKKTSKSINANLSNPKKFFFGIKNPNWTGSPKLNGTIDEIRIYNRALNENEVKKLHLTNSFPKNNDSNLLSNKTTEKLQKFEDLPYYKPEYENDLFARFRDENGGLKQGPVELRHKDYLKKIKKPKLKNSSPSKNILSQKKYKSETSDLILLNEINTKERYYLGERLRGEPNGKGKWFFTDGSKFEGYSFKGVMSKGIFTFPDGKVFEGSWKTNRSFKTQSISSNFSDILSFAESGIYYDSMGNITHINQYNSELRKYILKPFNINSQSNKNILNNEPIFGEQGFLFVDSKKISYINFISEIPYDFINKFKHAKIKILYFYINNFQKYGWDKNHKNWMKNKHHNKDYNDVWQFDLTITEGGGLLKYLNKVSNLTYNSKIYLRILECGYISGKFYEYYNKFHCENSKKDFKRHHKLLLKYSDRRALFKANVRFKYFNDSISKSDILFFETDKIDVIDLPKSSKITQKNTSICYGCIGLILNPEGIITGIIKDSPAGKSNKLKVGDKISGIATTNNEFISLQNIPVKTRFKLLKNLLRGQPDSKVGLKVLRIIENNVKAFKITLIRGVVNFN